MSVNEWHRTRFKVVAAWLLLATGVAKLVAVFGSVPILAEPDPLVGFLARRNLLLVAAVMEIAIAGYILLRKSQLKNLLLVAWLATVFLGYRLGLWVIGYQGACGCLGKVTDSLNVSPVLANFTMQGLLAYLLLFSYGYLIVAYRQGGSVIRKNETPAVSSNKH